MYTAERTWDLDVLLPGGIRGEAFDREVDTCRAQLDALHATLVGLPPVADATPDEGMAWRSSIVSAFAALEQVQLVHSFALCHASAHTNDEAARHAVGRTGDLQTRLQAALGRIARAVRGAADADLSRLSAGALADYEPWLRDLRKGQALELAPDLQGLLDEADRELIQGWSQLYGQVTGRLTGTLVRDGRTEQVGVGQLVALAAYPDAAVRRDAFAACDTAFTEVSGLCATALTHLVGTRQMRNDRVGVDELARSLHYNRVDRDVVEAMWAGVDHVRPALVRYLKAKARLVGQDALAWWDLAAPVGTPPAAETLDWDAAQRLIVGAFAAVEPELAASARRLLSEGAVESADRPDKRVGASCIPFGLRRTSRIFTTFSGTLESAALLAHELGHGWHADVLYTVPMVRRLFTPAFAETASMYAENLVRDHTSAPTGDMGRRLYALDQQLQGGVALLLNIRARYEFERACARLRRSGPLSPSVLCDLMVDCQQEAMGGALRTWDPLLWAKKPHFYNDRTAFNNWPYCFGYLFSGALRGREGVRLREVLIRTGWQDARALGREVLGVELADPAFWVEATEPLAAAAEAFEGLCGSVEGNPR
ncbi:MAG: hypothetical protein Q8P41_11755 [Pseudomonadota bacterium]|nr:hypothetical protein [Pseudomonadota bacterium]